MGSLADALEALQPYVYGGLFLVALIQWRRRPGRSSLWLVATFGVLAAVVLAGVILPEDSADPAMEWVGRALIAVLVLFPYFLYRFTTTLLPPIPCVNVTGTVLTASIAIIVLGGQELLERLSADPRTADFPVVAISADVTAGQHARLTDAGARDFVPKPFDVERLLRIVDEFCGGAPIEDAGTRSSNGKTRSLIHPSS